MIALRAVFSLIALATAIGVAYIAMVGGLGSNSTLSSPNTVYAIKTGFLYGVGLVVLLNFLPYRNAKQAIKLTGVIMIGMHFAFGLGFMVWVAAMAIA